jgi:hypothetical protein
MWGDFSGEIDWIGTPKPLPKIPGKLVRVKWACSLGEEISQEKKNEMAQQNFSQKIPGKLVLELSEHVVMWGDFSWEID